MRARHALLRALSMLAPVGMGAGLGACGEATDTHVPAVVRGAQPITAGPATLPAAAAPDAHLPARDGLALPVMHTVD
ncbi:hypothetical protein [Ralstonia pseudosolanacearum]|uniref:hypothetical protein n=1 Tax=Ralstonia pseudosolanacearum TaxID=1310165 RepID=UPI0006915643|nr:hypothetical protein [Ralstonia pseudosolanacearum]AST26010.1 hypothetical protein CDC45_01635 [Ralstonia pseudosolanacearum]MDC6282028.1 hypothetical protein [Ralstonia pseudosolanacearum]